MSRLHVFAALLGMSLPVVALAGPIPESPAVVKNQSGMKAATSTQAEILNPKLGCGSPSNSSFTADIKNTGPATASYTPTLVITQPGECAKMEPGKNPDGTPCKPGQMLCLGHCAIPGPDKSVTYPATAMSIAAGATTHLHIAFANTLINKAEIKVLEQGKGLPVTKSVPVPLKFFPCIF